MPSKNYWINRANQRMDDYILQSERVADEIAKAYYKASRMVEKDMIKTIQGLSALSDTRTAVQALRSNPSKRLLNQLRNAVQTMPEGKEKQEALTLLSSPAYQFRLRRLQETIDTARRRCEELYKAELDDTTEHLRSLYGSAFSRTIYDIDKGYNTLHTFSLFPESRVDKLLRSRWSGLNYSDRIWNSTQDLADVLKEQLLIAFMTGATVSETSRAIREQFQSSAYAARRLVRTETNFIANQAELDSYKRLGIEEYQYIATLDTRTSKQCQRLDNQVFNVEDAKPGVNYPPMHPNCRSTTIMYDAEEQIKERIARDENGKPIHVPGNMKYSEWLEKYHPELIEKLLISETNGGTMFIGRSGVSGAARKPKPIGYIEPMPKKQLRRIMKAFAKNGGVIQMSSETDAYLDSKNAEAITYNAKTILLRRNPGRASVFEELIHTAQYRNGENDGSYESRLKCEIYAQKKLLKYKKVYKLTEAEIEQTKAVLRSYEAELREYYQRGE